MEHRDRLTLAALALCLGAGPARAQDWVTPDACAVSPADLAAVRFDPAEAARVAAAAARIENGQGRFWRITAPGGQVSHLWGTFHSSDRLILDLPEELERLIPAASVLVLESDPVARSRAALEQRQLQPGMWLAPADPPYPKGWLGRDLAGWAAARIGALTGDPAAIERLTDAGLAALLLTDPCEDFAAGILPAQDHRLLLAAHEAGVPVAGLEAPDAFTAEMSQPERHDTARAIATAYAAYLNPDGYADARRAAFALYLRGQMGAMMEWNRLYLDRLLGAEKAARTRALADGYLIGERNRQFARGLARHLDRGGALVAVGSFHLPGDEGLIALLRQAGYRVDRVPVAGEAS
jgi:uncharacterized protein